MGGSLKGRVHNLKAQGVLLPPIDFLHVATSVASGLAFLHSGGLVYRDLKSGGVLFGATGVSGFSVVLDAEFGVVRFLLDQIAALHTRTSPGVGAALDAAYMAPEMLKTFVGASSGPTPLPPADIYSLGCVLYECVVGHPPFRGLREIEICKCLLAGVRPPLPDTVPLPIVDLIKACWKEDPAHRPTARGVLDRLRALDAQVRSLSELGKPSSVADLVVIVPNINLATGEHLPHLPAYAPSPPAAEKVKKAASRGSATFDLAAFANSGGN